MGELWSWRDAFARNEGLITSDEQRRLARATVAIAGAGGVGGGHLLTLARQGVGGFRVADADCFSIGNLNRQAGARVSSVGQNKATELKRLLLDINPEARIDAWEENIGAANVDAFLDGVDVVLDGLDFFAIEARRLLFAMARRRGLWVLTAGPLGFSTVLLAFDPDGMTFDEYFGINSSMSTEQQLIAFLVGLAPSHTHTAYMDLSKIDTKQRSGPSSIIACQLCSSFIAMETVCLLLNRRRPPAAPRTMQLDAYRQVYVQRRVWAGGRNPLQRLKRKLVTLRLRRLGVLGPTSTEA